MRRHTISGALAILTFAAGVGCVLLSYRFMPPAVSLCELDRHPDWYNQKVVRVTASATALYGAVFISKAACDERHGAGATVMLSEGYRVPAEVEAFLNGDAPEVRRAEVLVEGRFDKDAPPGCFGPRFGIHAKSVELKSPVSVEPLPGKH